VLKLMTPIVLVGAFAIAATAYAISSSSSADRADCPGKIACPLTGDLVCKDRCPVGTDTDVADADTPSSISGALAETDAIRLDCPGKVVCPLTGDLVCEDRCPVDEQAASDQTAEIPACCREK